METLKIKHDANDIYPFGYRDSHPFYLDTQLNPIPSSCIWADSQTLNVKTPLEETPSEEWKSFWSKVEKSNEIDPKSLYTHTDSTGNPICLPAIVVGYCYAQILLSAPTIEVSYHEAISSGPQRNISANRDWKGISLTESNYGVILGFPIITGPVNSYNISPLIDFLTLVQNQMGTVNDENAWSPIVRSFFHGVDFAYAEAGKKEESKNGVVTQYIESLTKNLLFDFTHEDRSARGTLEKAVRQLEAEGIDFRLFGTAWETLYQKIVLARATAESLGLSVSILTHDVSEIPDIANFIEDYCTDNTSLMIFLFLVIAEQAGRDNSLAKGSDVGDYIRLLPCTESIIPQLTDSETEFLNDLLATLRQDLTIFNSFALINRNFSAIKTKHNAEDIRSTIIKLLTPAKQ